MPTDASFGTCVPVGTHPSDELFSDLHKDVVRELQTIASRVRQRIRSTTREIIETGIDLLAAKQHLGHGQFLAWVDAEFRMTARTARNYMRAAQMASGKAEIVSTLPPTAIYLLSSPSTPEEVRREVIAKLEAGECVDSRAVEQAVKEQRRKPRDIAARLTQPLESGQSAPEPKTKEEVIPNLAAELIGLLRQLPEGSFERVCYLLSAPGVCERVPELISEFVSRATSAGLKND